MNSFAPGLDAVSCTMYGLHMANENIPLRPYTKMTLNLIPKAADDLAKVSEATGINRTDTVNRALQMYAFLVEQQVSEKLIMLQGKDGTVTQFRIIL